MGKDANKAESTWGLHKQTEKMLDLFSRAISDATNGIVITEHKPPDNLIIYVNPVFERITGYSLEDVLGTDCRFLQREDKEQPALKEVRAAIREERDCRVVLRNYRKDGSLFWNELNLSPVRDENGQATHYIGIISDISERKRVESILRTSEKKFKDLVEITTDWVWEIDKDGVYTYVSPKVSDLLGYEPEEVIGKKPFDLMSEEEAERMSKLFKEKAAKGEPVYQVENVNRHKDGHLIVLETNGIPIFDENGQLQGYRGIDRDITERKKAEKVREELLHNIGERAKELNCLYSLSKLIENPDITLERVFQEVSELLVPSWQFPDITCARIVYDDKEFKTDNFKTSKWKQSAIIKVYGKNVGIVEVCYLQERPESYEGPFLKEERDLIEAVAERLGKFVEREQIERARDTLNKELKAKNKELESILYITSHDLRAPLLNIQGFSQELSHSCEQLRSAFGERLDEQLRAALDEGIPDALGYISTSTSKMDSLLSGLLQLFRSGQSSMRVEPLDMNAIMAEVLGSMEYQIKEAGATVEVGPLPSCLGDSSQINQVFSNLLDNAIKYLEDTREGVIKVYGSVENGRSIYCVEDNGSGIAPDHHERVFEIFGRLRPDKTSGEGLGLSIVKRILDRNNGSVWVESEAGKGSKFFVSLQSV